MAEQRRVRGARRELATLVIAVILIAVAMGGFYSIQRTDTRDETWVELARAISSDIGEIVDVGETATRGLTPDFLTLAARVEDLDLNVDALAQGDPDAGIEPVPEAVQDEVAEVSAAWNEMKGTVQTVLDGEQAWRRSAAATRTIVSAIHAESGEDVFSVYDPCSFEVLRLFEMLGACKEGEGGAFCAGDRLTLTGTHPTNLDGGMLAYSWTGTAQLTMKAIEGVRQVRGTAGNHQVSGAELAFVSNAGSGAMHIEMMLLGKV